MTDSADEMSTMLTGLKRKREVDEPLVDDPPRATSERVTLESLGIPHCLDLTTDHKKTYSGGGEFSDRSALVIADEHGKLGLYIPATKARLDVSLASSLFIDVMRQLGFQNNPNQQDAHGLCYKETSDKISRGVTKFGGRMLLDKFPCGIASFDSGNIYASKKIARTCIYTTLCLAWFLTGKVNEWWEPTAASGSAQDQLSKKAVAAQQARRAAVQALPEPVEMKEDSPKPPAVATVVEKSQPKAKKAGAQVKVASQFWRDCTSSRKVGAFSVVVLHFEPDGESPSAAAEGLPPPGPYRPLAILTRLAMPLPFEQIPLQLYDFYGRSIKCRPQAGADMELDASALEKAFKFTLLLMQAYTFKPTVLPFEKYPYSECPYFVLPVAKEDSSVISWQEVNIALGKSTSIRFSRHEYKRLEEQCEDILINIPDEEHGKTYFVKAVRRDIDPLTATENVGLSPDVNGVQYPSLYQLQACKPHYFGKSGLLPEDQLKDWKQPVLELNRLPPAVNMCQADHSAASKFRSATKYRWPELIGYRPIPKSIYLSAQTLPTVMTLLDDMLLASEVNSKYLANKAKVLDVAVALSAPSAVRGSSYERLEFLGDSFLRFGVGAYFFNADLKMPSNRLTISTRAVTDNRPLKAAMERSGADAYMRIEQVTPPSYCPTRHLLGSDHTGFTRAKFGYKPVADVCEALVAAAGLADGPCSTIEILRNLGCDLPKFLTWSDYGPISSGLHNDPPPISDENYEAISGTIGYQFKDRRLLALALSSHLVDKVHHGRLAYLGSGILKYLVTMDLFELDSGLDPLALTLWKVLLVSPEGLAVATSLLGLVRFLQPLWTEQSIKDVQEWEADVRRAADAEDGSIRSTWITFKTIRVRSGRFR